MKKNVLIITHCFDDDNYGGNLQAYALPTFLNKNGYNALQIRYSITHFGSQTKKISKFNNITVKTFAKKVFNKFKNTISNKSDVSLSSAYNEYAKNRLVAFQKFQSNYIPHTNKEYNDENIAEVNDEADYFITGSDQVFNYDFYRYGFWLQYINKDKVKLSYAGSMALEKIPNIRWKRYTYNSLKSFNAISVREEKTRTIYSKLMSKDVQLTVDPTLLLAKEDYDKIASPRLVKDKYIFTYFLGNNQTERNLAREYAKKHNCLIANIPCAWDDKFISLLDGDYGDINMPYASPHDFISLIKYSNAVFTDSFHASIFSMIYNVNYVVFNKNSEGSMSSRIVTLTKLFHTEGRYLDSEDKCTINDVETALKSDASYLSKEFDNLKESSINFLLENLKD